MGQSCSALSLRRGQGELRSREGPKPKTITLEHVAAVIKKDPMFDFVLHLVEGVGLETSIEDIPGITKSVKAVEESDDFKERYQITKMMKLKTKKSDAQGNSSSHTESKGLSEASWSRCTSD